MNAGNAIAEHLAEESKTQMGESTPMLFIIGILFFVVFLVLQRLTAKKGVSYWGYIGCGLLIIFSLIVVAIYISDTNDVMYTGKLILNAVLLFLLSNIFTVVLFIVSLLTNRKNKNKKTNWKK